jgi:hypothetical protein
MPVPANRVPVRVARAVKSVLTANLSSFKEGEVVYAKDENMLYVVEGGVLTSTGANSIDQLADVNTSSTPPTGGQALVWDSGTSQWKPGDTAISNLDNIGDVDAAAIQSPSDGRALIYQNGKWVAGPAIGGFRYPVTGLPPTGMSPVGWWDSSDASTMTLGAANIVTEWRNKASSSWHLTPNAGGNEPTYSATGLGSTHGVVWPSTDNNKNLTNSSATSVNVQEIYVVCKYTGNASNFTNYDTIFGPRGGGASPWLTALGNTTGFYTSEFSEVYLLGHPSTNRVSNVFTEIGSPCIVRAVRPSGALANTSGFTMGCDRDNFTLNRGWSGAISEVIVFPSLISAANRAALLSYLAAKWTITLDPAAPGTVSGAYGINNLDDVDTATTAPTTNQFLKWNGTNWVPGNGSSVAGINDLTDVDTATSAPTSGQVLAWNGTNWVPATRLKSDTTQAGTNSVAVQNVVKITQANYDALGSKDANTVYFIV